MKTLLTTLALTATLAFANAMPADLAEIPPVRNVSLALLQEVAASAKTENICLSPWSAGAALSLIQTGAAEATRTCMNAVLGDPARWKRALESSDIALVAANRVYADKQLPLKASYRQSLPPGSVEAIDFLTQPEQARSTINNWAEEKTDGLIRDLLPPGSITANTCLTAVNAIVFHGKWALPFSARQTREAPFQLSSGQTVLAPMMNQLDVFRYAEDEDCKAIALSYGKRAPSSGSQSSEGNVFFIALLPKSSAPVRPWLNKLTPERLEALRAQLASPKARKHVNLSLPRFAVQSPTMNLRNALSRLGMQIAFGETADFSGIAELKKALFLSDVYQKCLVEVDESGTKAAAATAAVLKTRSLPRFEAEFIANRPFVWMITTLEPDAPAFFAGVLEHPEKAQ